MSNEKNLSQDNAKELFANEVDSLLKSLEQGSSEKLENFLSFYANFPGAKRLSLRNYLLLRAQAPNARFFGTYKEWKSVGRYPKAGTGLFIYIPTFSKKDKDKKVDKEDGKQIIPRGYFLKKCYFADTSTEGKSIPDDWFTQKLGNEFKDYYFLLKEVIESKGITISEDYSDSALGVSYGGRIALNRSLFEDEDFDRAFHVLIHEYAHEIMHKGSENRKLPRGIKECQAEATAYIVAKSYGLDSPISSDYLIHFGNDAKTLMSNLRVVLEASQRIKSELDKALGLDGDECESTDSCSNDVNKMAA